MFPSPIALGLAVCEKVIVEGRTNNVTLVSCFTKMVVEPLPSLPQRFAVYAALRDGQGFGTIAVVVTQLDTDEDIYLQESTLSFPDRLTEVRILFKINQCSFPAAGRYLVTLLVDGDALAQREIEIAAREE